MIKLAARNKFTQVAVVLYHISTNPPKTEIVHHLQETGQWHILNESSPRTVLSHATQGELSNLPQQTTQDIKL